MVVGAGDRPLTIQRGFPLWIDCHAYGGVHRAALLVGRPRFPNTSTLIPATLGCLEDLPIERRSQVALGQLQDEDKPLIISACRWLPWVPSLKLNHLRTPFPL
jgi:hypothetical protein